MTTTQLGDLKSLIKDIEAYAEENSNKLILHRLFKRPLMYFVRILKLSYNILNKNRVNLETKKMFTNLKNIHSIKPGDLLKLKEQIIVCTTITETDKNSRTYNKHFWQNLDAGSIVMFLGVENDFSLDIVVLKILKKVIL